MAHYDVFNGDADGICALHQLRLAAPLEATLVTGVKRDIGLLARVPAIAGDSVTALDISLDRNRDALLDLLGRGVRIEYFDHHFAGTVPTHPGLLAHIDPAPLECTSTLVDRHLDGRHRLWAVVAAFGDNLAQRALALGRSRGLGEEQLLALRELGQGINYNAYGECEADLLLAPAALYRALRPYSDPFDFIARDPVAARLSEGRRQDMAQASAIAPAYVLPVGTVHVLPDAPWARRVQGEFANALAVRSPGLAHAVLCQRGAGYNVSVRAPLGRPAGADRLCRRFPGGGGRAGAAGIDRLAVDRLAEFIHEFGAAFAAGTVGP
jgi:hypothetical protein